MSPESIVTGSAETEAESDAQWYTERGSESKSETERLQNRNGREQAVGSRRHQSTSLTREDTPPSPIKSVYISDREDGTETADRRNRSEDKHHKRGHPAISREVERLVAAACEDYPLREREIERGRADAATLTEYRLLNRDIDDALREALPALNEASRRSMREDIAIRRGALYTPLYTLSPATYKRYKAKAKYCIAKRLGFLSMSHK